MVVFLFGSGELTRAAETDFQKFFNSLREKPELGFELTEVRGCPVYPQFSFHKCHFKLDDFELIGTGEDFSHEVSQWKALGEVLERWPLLDRSFVWTIKSLQGGVKKEVEFKSSNGCAFHYDQDEALLGAQKELLERHTILKAWLEKTEVHEVQFNLVGKIQQYLNNVKNLAKSRTLYFHNDQGLPIFCTEIWGKNFRFYGYGTDLNKDKAILKSYYEAWRFFWGFEKGQKREISADEDPCLGHFYYWLNSSGKMAFNVGKGIPYEEISSLEKLDYNQGEAYLCDLSQKGIHGFVYKVIDSNLTDLWVGPLGEKQGKREAGEIHPIA